MAGICALSLQKSSILLCSVLWYRQVNGIAYGDQQAAWHGLYLGSVNVFATEYNNKAVSAVWYGIYTRSTCLLLTLTSRPAVPCGRYVRKVKVSLSTSTIRSIVPCVRYLCNVNVFAADASKNYTSVMCEILYAKFPLSLFHA